MKGFWEICFLSVCFVQFSRCDDPLTFITLDNGCTWNSTETSRISTWGDFQAPLLNCSHLKLTNVNFTGVPKTTVSIDLSYNKLTRLNVRDFAIFPKLKRLELRKNNLNEMVGNKSIVIDTVDFITLSQNNLKEIPQQWLASFPTLRTLTIYSNEITHIKATDFKENKKIKALALGPNPLEKEDDADWLMNFNATFLMINKMGLTKIPSHIAKMTELVHLSMSGNSISTIPHNAFAQCKKLKYLELSHSKVQTLQKYAFKGTYSLTSLDLSDNLITTLPNGLFTDMDDERVEVQLYENPLNCSCELAWFKRWTDGLESRDLSTEIHYKCEQPYHNHGKKSYELSVSDFTCTGSERPWVDCNNSPTIRPTKVTTTPESEYGCPRICVCYDKNGKQYFPEVKKREDSIPLPKRGRIVWRNGYHFPLVNCENKKLKLFPKDVPKNVKTLIFANNSITKFSVADLEGFDSLEILDLDGNGMTEIVPKDNVQLKALNQLSMAHNRLSNVTSKHLSWCPKLKKLRIHNNELKVVDKNMFKNNRKLTYFYLGPNPVQNFDATVLQDLPLRLLGLRNTSLKSIPKQIKSIDSLISMDVSDNKIMKLVDDRLPASLNYLRMDNNKLNEISADAFKTSRMLRNIELSENELVTLPEGVFNNLNFDRLQIRLWENPIECNCSLTWFKKWIDEVIGESGLSEVKFVCYTPRRVHGKHSDTMRPQDFTCKPDDVPYTENSCSGMNDGFHTRGQLALAIILTLLLTFIVTSLCCRCFCDINIRRFKYERHSLSTTQLDLDDV